MQRIQMLKNKILNLITDEELRFYYDNFAEAFELRLPEIANNKYSYKKC